MVGGECDWYAATVVKINPSDPADYNTLFIEAEMPDDVAWLNGYFYVGGETSPSYTYKIGSDLQYTSALTSNTVCYGTSEAGGAIWGTYVGSPGKVVELDSNLGVKATYLLPSGYNDANELAFDSAGNMYITCWESPAKLVRFDRDLLPSQPSNVSPADSESDVGLVPTLQSSVFYDPDSGDSHGASQWQIRTSSGSYSSAAFDSTTDSSNLTSITVPPGKLSCSTTYYWHVRYQDNRGAWSNYSDETSFTTQPPGNQAPYAPSGLSQFRSDGATVVGIGGATVDRTIAFKATVADPDGDQVKLQIELRRLDEYGGAFDDTKGGLKESTLGNSGTLAVAYASELIDADYHWRARTVDEHGGYSQWVDFGSNPVSTPDFTVSKNLTLVEKYAPVLYLSSGERNYPCSFYFDGNLSVSDNPANYASLSLRPPYHVYVNMVTDSQYFTIQYWLYYAYNDHPYNNSWDHPHDWECVYVVFDKDNLSKPEDVGFSQHSWVEYRDWDSVSLQGGTHPISYVACGSHSNYFSAPPVTMACSDLWKEPKQALAPSDFVYELADDTSGWPSFTTKVPAPWSRDEWQETDPLREAGWIMGVVCSPVELRFYDANGNVTGLVGGDIRSEIPGSYCEGNVVVLTDPSGSYTYEVVGTGDGSYDLTLVYYADSSTSLFSATEIPCSVGTVHRYTVDWDALTQGGEGVNIQVDSNGDGKFEDTFTAGNELNHDEFLSVIENAGLALWVWTAIGAGAALIVLAVAYLVIRRRSATQDYAQ